MRDQVCIVLNEREQSKAQAAEAVARVLAERNITSSRVLVSESLVTALRKRAPDVLIIDYLLGDLTTGLDVVASLLESSEHPPKVILYTDEPSMRVAVDAMKLGAIDYIAIESSSSLTSVVRAVESAIAGSKRSGIPSGLPLLSLKDLVAHSPASRRMIQHAEDAAREGPPITVVHGPEGSGVATLCRAIARARALHDRYEELNLRTDPRPLRAAIYPGDGSSRPLLAPGQSAVVLNVEYDDGELVPLVERARKSLWGTRPSRPTTEFLIIGSHDSVTAQRWLSLPDATGISVPHLAKRGEDIPGLFHAWTREFEAITGEKRKVIPADAIHLAGTLDWKGGLRQLRAAIFYSLARASKDAASIEEHIRYYHAEVAVEDQRILTDDFSPAAKAWALQKADGDIRSAAVYLGTSPQRLRSSFQRGEAE